MHSVWHPIIVLFQILFPILGGGFPSGGGGTSHTYTYVSRGTGCSTTSASGSITCTANAAGDFIQVYFTAFNNGSAPTCTLTGLTKTPNSPTYILSTTETVCIGYVFSASAGSQTYSASFTNATANTAIAMEFSCSPACSSVTLDQDTGATTASASTPVNTPNAVAASSAELLTSSAYTSDGAVACGGSWTLAGPAVSGNIACYILSGSSGSTAVSICEVSGCADTGMDSWAAMAATWK